MSRTLAQVTELLERIAPLSLAEDWDNVGLLVEPSRAATRAISRAFLCIDLEPPVLDEAIAVGAELVIAYHPPIFRGHKRLRASHAEESVVLRAIEAGLAVYSPHTALDAAANGVNDWLGKAFGPGRSRPIQPKHAEGSEFKLVVFVPRAHVATLRRALARELGAGTIGNYTECSYELDGTGTFLGNDASSPAIGARGQLEPVPEVRLEMRCPGRSIRDVQCVIAAHHPYEEPAWDLYPLALPGDPKSQVGAGRVFTLDTPISISDAVARLKQHLGVPTLRVATSGQHAAGSPIARIAVCAGAGGSLFEAIRSGVDLFVTGELRHHDVLAKQRSGASVILSEHTHTERGFLPEFARKLEAFSDGQLEVTVSRTDADPLRTL